MLKSIDIIRRLFVPLAYGQGLAQQIKGTRILSANHAQGGHVKRVGSTFESLHRDTVHCALIVLQCTVDIAILLADRR